MQWAVYALTKLNLNQYSTGSAQPGLSVNRLETVKIPLPPLTEQRRVVAQIEARFAGIDKTVAAMQSQLDAITAMPAAILRQAFSGQL